MNHRVTTIACALLISAFAAPASQAGDRRSPDVRQHTASEVRSGAFANLGHEGSGLLARTTAFNAFANLGHEGSGLRTRTTAFNAFANLGHEGSGLSSQ